MTPTILTQSGRYFNLLEPERNVTSLTEIAHALSNLCRFNGHVREFYSVAQHSVLVSQIVPREDALAGLMHDIAEAFIGDVASPLKSLLSAYRKIERRIEAELFSEWGLPAVMPESVKHADLVLLATEQRDLMPKHDDEWASIAGIEPLFDTIVPMTPTEARQAFIARYRHLRDC